MASRLKSFYHRIRNSEFIGNVLVMITGTGIAQLIPVLIIPLLTRLYTPGEIGVLAAFVSLFTICSIIAGGRYEYAVILPEEDTQGTRLLQLASLLSLATGILLFIAVFLFGPQISHLLGIPAIAPWLWFLPLAVTAQGLFMTFSFGLNRNKKYRDIARGKVSQSGSTALIQVAGGVAGWGIAGLIIGKVSGILVSAFWLVMALYQKAPFHFRAQPWSELKKTAADYSNYPKFNAPHAFTNTLSNSMPVLLFVTFFTEIIAGFYAMAIRACYVPVQIVSLAFGQVLAKRLAELKQQNRDVYGFVKNTLGKTLAAGLIPFGLLFAAGPTVFGFILGPDWAVTGDYVRILTPYVYLTFASQPLSYIPLLYDEQKNALFLYIVSLLLRFAGIIAGIWADSFYLSLTLYSLTGVLTLIWHLYWYLALCRRHQPKKPQPDHKLTH